MRTLYGGIAIVLLAGTVSLPASSQPNTEHIYVIEGEENPVVYASLGDSDPTAFQICNESPEELGLDVQLIDNVGRMSTELVGWHECAYFKARKITLRVNGIEGRDNQVIAQVTFLSN
ncbi:MAG: hypothetical protein V3V03_07080 [Hyphomonadaceae bacterium]